MADRAARHTFNTITALEIGANRWGKSVSPMGLSKRFAYFEDDKTFTMVAGIQEGEDVQRALALGLSYRKNRPLRLVLPDSHLHATQMRLGWIKPGIVSLWSHNGRDARKRRQPSEATLLSRVGKARWSKPTPSLSKRATILGSFAEWIDSLPDVQPAHRQDYRSWQCRGRGVLRVERRQSGVDVTAGVNRSGYDHRIFELAGAPDARTIEKIKALVLVAVEQRLGDQDARHMDAENWLQSVLREHSDQLGLAEPVIRELAAWRPRSEATDAGAVWGRGFVDLVGLDSLGTVHLVETKVGPDDLLVLQGLDYYIWSLGTKNKRRLCERLDVDDQATAVIDYVIGGSVGSDGAVGVPLVSEHTRAQVDALRDDVVWSFYTTQNWFPGPEISIHRLGARGIPKSSAKSAGD